MCNFNATCCFRRHCNWCWCHHGMTNTSCFGNDNQEMEKPKPTNLSEDKVAKKPESKKLKSTCNCTPSAKAGNLASENVAQSDCSWCNCNRSDKLVCQLWPQEKKECLSKSTNCSYDDGPNEVGPKQATEKTRKKKAVKRKVTNRLQEPISSPMKCTRPKFLGDKNEKTMWFECNMPIRVGIPGTVGMNTPCNLFNSNMQIEIGGGMNRTDKLPTANSSLVKSGRNPIPPKTALLAMQPTEKSKMYITVRPLGFGSSGMPHTPVTIPPASEPVMQETVPKLSLKKKVVKRKGMSPQATTCTCRSNGKKSLSDFVEALKLIQIICKAKSEQAENDSNQKSARKHRKKNIPKQSCKRIPNLKSTDPETNPKTSDNETKLEDCKSCSTATKCDLPKTASKSNNEADAIVSKKKNQLPISQSTEEERELEPKGLKDLLGSLQAPAVGNNEWLEQLPHDSYKAQNENGIASNSAYSRKCNSCNDMQHPILKASTEIFNERPIKNNYEDESVILENKSESSCSFGKNLNVSCAQHQKMLMQRKQKYLDEIQELSQEPEHQNCKCFTKLLQNLHQEQDEQPEEIKQHHKKTEQNYQHQEQEQKLDKLEQPEKQHNQHQNKQPIKEQKLQQHENNSHQQHKPCCQKHKGELHQKQSETQKQQLKEPNIQDTDVSNKVPQKQQHIEQDLQPARKPPCKKCVRIEDNPRIYWSETSSSTSISSGSLKSTTCKPPPILKNIYSSLHLPMSDPYEADNKECFCSEYRTTSRMPPKKFYMQTLAKYDIKFMPGDCLNSEESFNSINASCSNA